MASWLSPKLHFAGATTESTSMVTTLAPIRPARGSAVSDLGLGLGYRYSKPCVQRGDTGKDGMSPSPKQAAGSSWRGVYRGSPLDHPRVILRAKTARVAASRRRRRRSRSSRTTPRRNTMIRNSSARAPLSLSLSISERGNDVQVCRKITCRGYDGLLLDGPELCGEVL